MPELHIPFRKIDLERARYKSSFPIQKPERNNIQYDKELKDSVRILQHSFEEAEKIKPLEFDPAFIFCLKIEGYVDDDHWRLSGLTVLSEEPDGKVVLFSKDQLAEFSQRVGFYSQDIPKGQKNPSYNWIAGITTEMGLWSREDRIGEKLVNSNLNPSAQYRLDVELWHYGSSDECRARMNQLKEFVENRQGEFLDSYVGSALSIARIKLAGNQVDALLDVGMVYSIDFPPQPQLSVGQLIKTPLDDFDTPIPIPLENSPTICVIDSGISRGHPLLANAIGDTIAIPEHLGDGLDDHGHGTQVAGIALYGNVKKHIESLDFRPEFFLLGAKVTNEQNRFDDDELIVTQMRKTIEYFRQEYNCRIFNISLGDPRLVYHDGKPSAWAHMLDTLVRELDVVLVVSAGNLPLLGVSGEEAERIRGQYPQFLLDDESRIIEPATAANVITVGSLANSETSHLMKHENDPAIRCIASIDQPSPFTRCGPGVNGAIKPEVCEYGGNITWDGRAGGRILNSDPEAGVISTNRVFQERLFTSDIGTSLAAPKVAHVAAKILKHYPDASANLIRALIANSSSIPRKVSEVFNNEDDILRVCGYGKPDETKAVFSSEERVTLIAEDVISLDTIHLYEIPIPDELKLADGRRQITVTLAFDPPVKHTRKEYIGVKLKFKLLRGISTQRIIEWYSERPDDAEKIRSRFICNTYPSSTRRENGTLQKAVFTATKNRTFEDYGDEEFHLLISSQATWTPSIIDEQRYAVTVTIEHLEQPIELLNVIKQKVQIAEQVRIRA